MTDSFCSCKVRLTSNGKKTGPCELGSCQDLKGRVKDQTPGWRSSSPQQTVLSAYAPEGKLLEASHSPLLLFA